ncbi:MAG: hypothetical protein WD278_07875 [Pirellulales bacterium]
MANPDFFLSSSEDYEFVPVRECRVLKRSSVTGDKSMWLAEVDIPITWFSYKLHDSLAAQFVILYARHVGVELEDVQRQPEVWVNVFLCNNEPELRKKLGNSDFQSLFTTDWEFSAIAQIHKSREEAAEYPAHPTPEPTDPPDFYLSCTGLSEFRHLRACRLLKRGTTADAGDLWLAEMDTPIDWSMLALTQVGTPIDSLSLAEDTRLIAHYVLLQADHPHLELSDVKRRWVGVAIYLCKDEAGLCRRLAGANFELTLSAWYYHRIGQIHPNCREAERLLRGG